MQFVPQPATAQEQGSETYLSPRGQHICLFETDLGAARGFTQNSSLGKPVTLILIVSLID